MDKMRNVKKAGYYLMVDPDELLSTSCYKGDFLCRCVYCHKELWTDYHEHNGVVYNNVMRCDCEHAKEEAKAREALLDKLIELQKAIDFEAINKTIKESALNLVERAYSSDEEDDWSSKNALIQLYGLFDRK